MSNLGKHYRLFLGSLTVLIFGSMHPYFLQNYGWQRLGLSNTGIQGQLLKLSANVPFSLVWYLGISFGILLIYKIQIRLVSVGIYLLLLLLAFLNPSATMAEDCLLSWLILPYCFFPVTDESETSEKMPLKISTRRISEFFLFSFYLLIFFNLLASNTAWFSGNFLVQALLNPEWSRWPNLWAEISSKIKLDPALTWSICFVLFWAPILTVFSQTQKIARISLILVHLFSAIGFRDLALLHLALATLQTIYLTGPNGLTIGIRKPFDRSEQS